MGTVNTGRQDIVWRYEAPLRGNFFAQALHGLTKPGFVEIPGTTFQGAEVTIPIFSCFLLPTNSNSPASNKLVKIVTKEIIVLTVPEETIAVGISYEFRTESNWYADFDFILTREALQNYKGLIFCEIEMSGDLISSLYTVRAPLLKESQDVLVRQDVSYSGNQHFKINKPNSLAHGIGFNPPKASHHYHVGFLTHFLKNASSSPGLFFFELGKTALIGIEHLGITNYNSTNFLEATLEQIDHSTQYISNSIEDYVLLEKPLVEQNGNLHSLVASVEFFFPGYPIKIKAIIKKDFTLTVAIGVLFSFEGGILHQNFSYLSEVSDINSYTGAILGLHLPFGNRRLKWKDKVEDLFEPLPLDHPEFILKPYSMVSTRNLTVNSNFYPAGTLGFNIPSSSSSTKFLRFNSSGTLSLVDKVNSGNVVLGQYPPWTEASLPSLHFIEGSFSSNVIPNYSDIVGTRVMEGFEVISNDLVYISTRDIEVVPNVLSDRYWKLSPSEEITVIDSIGTVSIPPLEGKVQRFYNSMENYNVRIEFGRGDFFNLPPGGRFSVLYQDREYHFLDSVKYDYINEDIVSKIFLSNIAEIRFVSTSPSTFLHSKIESTLPLVGKNKIWSGEYHIERPQDDDEEFNFSSLIDPNYSYYVKYKNKFNPEKAFSTIFSSETENLMFFFEIKSNSPEFLSSGVPVRYSAFDGNFYYANDYVNLSFTILDLYLSNKT